MTGAKVIFAAGLLSGSLDIAVTGILRRAQGVSFQKLLQNHRQRCHRAISLYTGS